MNALFLMFIGHAIADYPLQGDWLSKAKNQKLSLVSGEVIWPSALASHALIHAGAVWLVTGSIFLAWCEFFAHGLIDYSKCAGRLNYNQDQALHVLCKVVWALLLFYGVAS